ncbi:hypothetical protein PLICRDRAFT_265132 [Plicaturopsis crispa FD-325 SS-3]|nr:hypothetical protein PLICRDRAFT_265132 [Plicaturopsis crispa FD-325 SS-3]
MTTRQAVLASVVDSTHVSLNEGRKKKKELNEAEIALKREETARKRKHLSEKKLEDEKADTINRLLKKQSRPKNKRAALATADEPVASGSRPASEADEAEPIIPDVPTTYRWISSTRNSGDVEGGRMTITLGVPVHAIPQVDDADKMDVEAVLGVATVDRKGDPICNVEGCTKDRKYRLVRDWTRGACGISHLKILEDIIAP